MIKRNLLKAGLILTFSVSLLAGCGSEEATTAVKGIGTTTALETTTSDETSTLEETTTLDETTTSDESTTPEETTTEEPTTTEVQTTTVAKATTTKATEQSTTVPVVIEQSTTKVEIPTTTAQDGLENFPNWWAEAEAEAKRKSDEVKSWATNLYNQLYKSGMSDAEVLFAYCNWQKNNSGWEYDYSYSNAYAYDIITTGKGVCQAYAEANIAFCDVAGIPCEMKVITIEEGQAGYQNSVGELHANNLVYIDNQWIQVDCYWYNRNIALGFLQTQYTKFSEMPQSLVEQLMSIDNLENYSDYFELGWSKYSEIPQWFIDLTYVYDDYLGDHSFSNYQYVLYSYYGGIEIDEPAYGFEDWF